jgi:hypothetical protein
MHAPTPKATMKEMLKFIGMLGAPAVAPAVMLRAGDDHMMEISKEFAKGYCVRRAKRILAPGGLEYLLGHVIAAHDQSCSGITIA